jgi:hypothetical protein
LLNAALAVAACAAVQAAIAPCLSILVSGTHVEETAGRGEQKCGRQEVSPWCECRTHVNVVALEPGCVRGNSAAQKRLARFGSAENEKHEANSGESERDL